MKMAQLMNSKVGAVFALASVAALGLFYVQRKGQAAVGEVLDPITNAFWSMFQESNVELTGFAISRLHRDFFDADWYMLPDAKATYKQAYPEDMQNILNVFGQLKEEYRDKIT